MEKISHRVKALFRRVDAIKGKPLRMALVAPVIGTSLAEATLFVMINQSVRAGELPAFATDALICSIALLEVVLSPILGWYGHTVRRRVIVRILLATAAACCLLFFMPRTVRDENTLTELCVGRNLPSALTTSSITRVILGAVVGVCLALGRVTVWCHALAYLNEHDPTKAALDVGVLVGVRLLILATGVTLIRHMVEQTPWLQILLIVLPFLFKAATLQRYPIVSPNAVDNVKCQDQRGLAASVGRVVSSPLAMALSVIASLLAAGLWGFLYNHSLWIKIKYNVSLDATDEGLLPLWPVQLYNVALVALVLTGILISGANYKRLLLAGELKKVTYLAMIAGGLYLYLTLSGCETGQLAGLSAGDFAQPQCSRTCGCSLPMDFSPVCVPEQQVTYYSPCHAGCAANELLHGIPVYANCSCGVASRIATVGACSDSTCRAAYGFHNVIMVAILTLGGIMLQSVGSLLLQTADPRDKAVVMGLCGSIVTLLTFVCTHAALLYIRVTNCAFGSEGSQCHYPTPGFVMWTGGLSAGLTFLAGIVAFVALIVVKRRQTKGNNMNIGNDVDKGNDDVTAESIAL